jgi:GGDEF domain-containing protein
LITTLLSYRVSLAISESELAIARLSIGQRERVTEDASLGAGTLYREVRRSRNHNRPLALLAVAIEEPSLQMNVDRIVQETQQAMMKQYALSALARLLCDRLEDCDTIVQNNEHFLILLPETTPEDIPGLIERLRRQSVEQIGVELKFGFASLHEDSYTLEGLIDLATQGINTNLTPDFILELKRMSA